MFSETTCTVFADKYHLYGKSFFSSISSLNSTPPYFLNHTIWYCVIVLHNFFCFVNILILHPKEVLRCWEARAVFHISFVNFVSLMSVSHIHTVSAHKILVDCYVIVLIQLSVLGTRAEVMESVVLLNSSVSLVLNATSKVVAEVRNLGGWATQHSHIPGRPAVSQFRTKGQPFLLYLMMRLFTHLLIQWLLFFWVMSMYYVWDNVLSIVEDIQKVLNHDVWSALAQLELWSDKILALPTGRNLWAESANNGHHKSTSGLLARLRSCLLECCPGGRHSHGIGTFGIRISALQNFPPFFLSGCQKHCNIPQKIRRVENICNYFMCIDLLQKDL